MARCANLHAASLHALCFLKSVLSLQHDRMLCAHIQAVAGVPETGVCDSATWAALLGDEALLQCLEEAARLVRLPTMKIALLRLECPVTCLLSPAVVLSAEAVACAFGPSLLACQWPMLKLCREICRDVPAAQV